MDATSQEQMIAFYINIMELSLLKKAKKVKFVFLLKSFDRNKFPHIEKLPLQLTSLDLKEAKRFADLQLEKVVTIISENLNNNKDNEHYDVKKDIIKTTQKITDKIIDKNKAEIDGLMKSYSVERLFDNFKKSKTSPILIQNQSKKQIAQYMVSVKENVQQNLELNIGKNSISISKVTIHNISEKKIMYSYSDYLLFTLKLSKLRQSKLQSQIRNLEDSIVEKKIQSKKNFLGYVRIKKENTSEKKAKKLLDNLKKEQKTELSINKKLDGLDFKSGYLQKKELEKILCIQTEISNLLMEKSGLDTLKQNAYSKSLGMECHPIKKVKGQKLELFSSR